MAYGFQETDTEDKKDAFWDYLDEEITEATNAEAGLIIQFDGNLWAGSELVPNDPRPQNKNGRLLKQFLEKNSHLTIVNSLSLCEGLITKSRLCDGILEESVLDFFIVCHLVLPHVKRMVIDVDRKYVLTNYKQARNGGKAADSDHATEFIDIDLKLSFDKPERRELWNFKNKESQEKFKILTSETDELSKCFKNDQSVIKQIENWKSVFDSYCRKAFKKVRITKKKFITPVPREVSELVDLRNELVNAGQKVEVEKLNEAISNIEAEMNRNKILENFKRFSEDPLNVNLTQVWKTMNKLWPTVGLTKPTAKKNHICRIVSEPNEIKKSCL